MFFITDLDNDIYFLGRAVFGDVSLFIKELLQHWQVIKLNHCWTHLIWTITLVFFRAALYLDRICLGIYELCNIDTAIVLNRLNIEMTSIMTVVFNGSVLVKIEVTLYLLTFYNTDIFLFFCDTIWIL